MSKETTNKYQSPSSFKIIKLPFVQNLTGLSRSAIYLKISNGEFPSSVSLGKRSVGWLENDVNNWIKQRIEESLKMESKKHP